MKQIIFDMKSELLGILFVFVSVTSANATNVSPMTRSEQIIFNVLIRRMGAAK